MPYCPKCKYEYREGIVTCPDCDEALVTELEEDAPDSNLVVVGTYLIAAEAEMAKLKLENHDIPAVVVGSLTSQCTPLFGIAEVRLLARERDATRAKQILQEQE